MVADTPLRWHHELADGTIRKTPRNHFRGTGRQEMHFGEHQQPTNLQHLSLPKTVVDLSFGSLLSTRMTSLLVLKCPIDILKLEKLQLTHAHERPVLLTHAMTP